MRKIFVASTLAYLVCDEDVAARDTAILCGLWIMCFNRLELYLPVVELNELSFRSNSFVYSSLAVPME